MADQWTQQQGAETETDVRIDPYYVWGEATHFFYLFGNQRRARERFSVSIRVREGFTAKQLANGDWGQHQIPPSDWQEWLTIPPIYADPPLGLGDSKVCTASVTRRFFAELRDKDSLLSKIVWRATLGLPLSTREPWKAAPPPPGGSSEPSAGGGFTDIICKLFPWLKICKKPAPKKPRPPVFTGIIDDGLAFAHQRFRGPDGKTRVEYLWNQDGLLDPPSEFPYGLELRKADSAVAGIDTNLDLSTRQGIVDEDWVYARTGHLMCTQSGHKPVAWRQAHGTHVMDVACGAGPGTAPDGRPIVGVQLPVAATADTSGGTLIPYVLDGLAYIFKRVGTTPVVINLSYGLANGPHDGSSDFETTLDLCVRERNLAGAPTAVVLPSGNSRLLQGHAQFTLGPSGSATDKHKLKWRVLPDDATPSYLEIWLPPSTGSKPKVKVKVQPPWGAESPPMGEGDPPLNWVPNGQPLCHLSYVNAGLAPYHRGMILVAIVATSTHDPALQVAPFGTWKISIKNIGERPIKDVRAWIRRDDTPYGYPRRGRQSRFEDPIYRRYHRRTGRLVQKDNASYIKRDGTISSLATGTESIVVGSFNRQTWKPARYSASGPVVSPPGRGGSSPDGPDGVAVSEDSQINYGVRAAGTRSGSTVTMYGTSVAAPQVTRWAVEYMALTGRCTRADFHAFLTLSTSPPSPWPNTRTELNPPPNAPGLPPAVRVGGGRVEFPPGTRAPTIDTPSVVDRLIEKS